MSSSWWMLIRSRLPDPVGGFIFIPVRKVHQKISLAAVMQRKTTRFRVCTNDRKRFIIKEKRLWNSSTLLSKFFRLWLSLWVPVSAFGVPSTCWKVMVTTTPAAMLMCGKVTNDNLIDSSHYFRNTDQYEKLMWGFSYISFCLSKHFWESDVFVSFLLTASL